MDLNLSEMVNGGHEGCQQDTVSPLPLGGLCVQSRRADEE